MEFYDVASHVLSVVHQGLTQEIADTFVSIENPPDDCCDFLAAWVSQSDLTRDFPTPLAKVQNCADTLAVRVQVKLIRSCWPSGKGTKKFPDFTDVEAAATTLYQDGRDIQCAMAVAAAQGALTPWQGRQVILGPVFPTKPSGGCAGWRTSVLCSVPLCCDDTAST